jgi:hypothetical protein
MPEKENWKLKRKRAESTLKGWWLNRSKVSQMLSGR